MAPPRTVSLLDADPDLGAGLVPERFALARPQLLVRVQRSTPGPWPASFLEQPCPEHLGILLLSGVLVRDVALGGSVSSELLGPGDLVRPWRVQEPSGLLDADVCWRALTPCRIVLLDGRLAQRLGPWPEVSAALVERVQRRTQRLAVTKAIAQLVRVDRRLLAYLWLLAARWGRVTPDGVVVPIALTHRLLGQLVGARRPTISVAMARLEARGELVPRRTGGWLLNSPPPALCHETAQRRVAPRRVFLKPTAVAS